MQPNFTRKNLRFFCTGIMAIALLLSVPVMTFAQQNPAKSSRLTQDQRVQLKLKNYEQRHRGTINPNANNDAGLPTTKSNLRTQSPNAVCQTFNGDFAGAPTMTDRLFRPGATSSCTVPYTFPGTFAQTVPYRVVTYTNSTGLTQCGTFTMAPTGAGSNAQFAIYSNSFNPANLAANYLADPGVSNVGTNVLTCQATIASGATIAIAVFDLGTPAASWSITVDFPVCSSAPCAGTPNPGNTLSTANPVCPGNNFTLSLQNATTGSGVTYQWQSAATTAGPWTNIGGATGSTYTTNIATSTAYRCNVTCSAGPSTTASNPIQININPPSACYCIPPPSDCTDDDVITRVLISNLDNSSTCSAGPPAGYSNYTSSVPAANLFSGAGNIMTVEKPTSWSEGVAVWIDYNQNGQFEASERSTIGLVNNLPSVSGTINIPGSALTGITRMRVRISFAGYPGTPCGAITFGETEDYAVNIQPCVPVTITTSPASTATVCGGNASFTVVTAGSLPSYAWEYRTSSAGVWQMVPNAAPYSGVNTATLTLTNVSAAYSGYQFRALVTGGCSAVDFSAAATLTVNPIVPVVTPSSATICVGTVQSLTLTNTLGNTDIYNEGFNTVSPLPAGWASQNLSAPAGSTEWFQGNDGVFPAQSGATTSYIGANFNNTSGAGTISNWLFTPVNNMKNGDQFSFWTRKVDPDSYADRLEVRLSTNGASVNAGGTSTSVGDYSNLLLSINPSLVLGVYPTVWTKYTVTLSGLPAGITPGRIAFRYFVTNGGPSGSNSDYIGIDNVTYTSAGGPAQGIWTGPAGTMWTNAGATIAYTGTPATTIYVNPTATSNYQVSFTTSTPCTSATTTVPVNVTNPVSAVVAPANKSVCVGGNTSFTTSASGGPLTYQWQVSVDGGVTYTNIGGAAGTAATLNLTAVTQVMNNNLYRCVITAAPCGSVTTASGKLTVNPLPVVTIAANTLQLVPGGTATFTASSTPAAFSATSYSWTLNGSNIAGATGNSVTSNIDGLGTYQATVTDINGCVNKSNILTLGAKASDRLWIYPNPNNGQFQVRLYYNGVQAERRIVRIYTTGGQLVAQKEFDMVTTTSPYMRMDFDLSRYSAATYVVKVVDAHAKEITSGLVVVQ